MKKSLRRKEVLGQVSLYLKPFKGALFRLSIVKVLLIAVSLITPYFFKLLIDNVMLKRQSYMLKWVCLLYAAAFLISSLLLTYQKIAGNKVYKKFSFDIKFKLWKNYTKMPQDFYSNYSTGDLKNRIDGDVETFEKFIQLQLLEYGFNWLSAITTAIVLIVLDWKLALFGFLMIPLSFWMTKWLGTRLKNSWEVVRQTFGEYEGWLQGSLQGWKEIKALNLEKEQSRIFTAYWHKLSKQIFAGRMYWFGNRCFIAIKDFFITKMNLYFLGGLLIINGELTIGTLLVFMKYYEQLFENIGSINDKDMELNSDIPDMERVLEMLRLKPKTYSKADVISDPFIGKVEVKNVGFSYEKSKGRFITNLQFSVKAGERLAIVGRSGCGKTTLIKLLLGIHYVDEGEILVDGKDLKHINPMKLHKKIGVVMQDGFLFNMTIRDNLLLAKPEATEAEIIEACKKAYIHEFIEALPQCYDTLIGEKGIKLSGGQKQRMAIAKVMLTAPKIIIFDEATSSLDNESEKMIHKAIDNLAKDRTIIVIAHRLSSIVSADRVLVMNEGSIVGEGSHDELLGKNEIYDALFKRQYMLSS